MRQLIYLSVCLFSLVTTAHSEPIDQARAAAELAPFKQKLQQALRSGLAHGPVEAITTCRIEAPAIATALSDEFLRLGRASHRLRNPDNVAPAWVVPVLDEHVAEPSSRQARLVTLPNDGTGYIEPIAVQPLCMTCHGTQLAPAVAAKIDELYPSDQARGYTVGELRGVFWLEFSPDR